MFDLAYTLPDEELYAAAYDLPPRVDLPAGIKLPDMLRRALQAAMTCESKIEPEVSRLRILQAEAKNEIEFNAREFQIESVTRQLHRAARLATMRYEHLQTITSKEAIEAELHKIHNDKAYWFQMYGWGYDPRARTPLSVVPFELHPKQAELVEWLDEIVFNQRTSGLIEKSRDEGATETIVRWGLHNWLFYDGFSMLLSTRKEDEVDSKKNQNTLFERVRYQMRLLPKWQHPKGFDVTRDMLGTMKLANPENQNTLLGEAPVENMGRGGRVTCAMLDEFAFWPFAGYPQFRSLSQTTDSLIIPSSVAGKMNQYADLAFDGVTRKFVMDWRDNPFKDKCWYDSLPFGLIGVKMTQTTIAQEVDRNYDAAQPGKVFTCPEQLVFITQSELVKAFDASKQRNRFYDDQDRFKIPDDWRVTRWHDYGQSEGHDWSYMLAGQPSAFYPYSDTIFIFVALNLEPNGLRTEQAVAQWRGHEQTYGLRNSLGNKFTHEPWASYNSHERKSLRKVLLLKYGERWHAWRADKGYDEGIEQVNDWWTPVENDLPNPYRPQLFGRCKLVFVAPDNEYQLAYNDRLATWFVTISESEKGYATARKQIGAYHYPESELGKAVKAMRPVKQFDDIIDDIKALGVMWNVAPPAASPQEKYMEHLAANTPSLLPENIANLPREDDRSLAQAREEFARREYEARMKQAKRLKDGGVEDYLVEVQNGNGNGDWREM